ncbi:hypothetical protein MRS76_24335 [Rhizobiaceae bacterium n13]|uniref:hypothetical protein n=1 Tax=Ferirhizobium litorale TaxID=2927786 RepID=UPI0024B2D828|nr:hypothetical protein [Fererhizobium litorale]MDI7865049.1 hypothetical protein [Fererhizobium litorale]
MPAKRRVSKARQFRITPDAVRAYQDNDDRALRSALKLPPWFPSPLNTDGPEPPEWAKDDGTAWTLAWPEAWELRLELEAAANE